MVSGGTGENGVWFPMGQVRMVTVVSDGTSEYDMWSLVGQVRMICGLWWDR